MKGKILDYNIENKSGIILADNGERFNFLISEWKATTLPIINQSVDFNVNNNVAESIYILNNSMQNSKSKIVAGILALFLGGFGVHKFYLGCTVAGIIMLVVFLFGFILLGIPSFVIAIIAFIEALIYFFKSDNDFEEKYVNNKKCWF